MSSVRAADIANREISPLHWHRICWITWSALTWRQKTTRSVWLSCNIPAGAAAGKYKGRVTIRAHDQSSLVLYPTHQELIFDFITGLIYRQIMINDCLVDECL